MAALLTLLIVVIVLDRCFPLPQVGRGSPYAVLVVARGGTPLRAFPDKTHIWRHQVTLDQVSPLYIEALIGYEDRTFWYHPGVNPLALLRAAGQWLRYGHIVSGGSTITMQVARIIEPTPHTLPGKLRQIARAVQLEMHYSKRDILTLYCNYTPMGGVLEGVEAASRAYLGKPARQLTRAEAALLTVLPQSPSLLRPDRFPLRAQKARDKVLHRLHDRWTPADIQDALSEPVTAQSLHEPMLAPLLAQRLHDDAPHRTRIDTTIDAQAQSDVEALLLDRARTLPPRVSLAALVMDNASLDIVAYAGSADFRDDQRFSQVDMVRAVRSPGSTLKPFLYGFAIEEGLIHSESLLSDTPQSFEGYKPGDFQQSFSGPVSASEALIKSLNVPAVQVLDHFTPRRFVSRLSAGGLNLVFPRGAEPNLAVILGGVGTTLEDLVSAYSALARHGMAGKPRLLADAPKSERRMLSPGAAFIIRDILETGGPVGRAVAARGASHGIAWKTGTSFGFRDAWSLGVTDRYTVGVWVGRPDGTPNPGFFGANVAAPLLMDIFSALPDLHATPQRQATAGVSQMMICWPLGTAADGLSSNLCPIQRRAWVLNGVTPPTFADPLHTGEQRYHYQIDTLTGLQSRADCSNHALTTIETARWPTTLLPWLDDTLRQRVLPPPWAPGCTPPPDAEGTLRIYGISKGEIIRRARGADTPTIDVEARGASGKLYWLVNGTVQAGANSTHARIPFANTGHYDITALDNDGHYDRVSVEVR